VICQTRVTIENDLCPTVTSDVYCGITLYSMDTDASGYVDSLLDASVRHSPHFDWVVAHIGYGCD